MNNADTNGGIARRTVVAGTFGAATGAMAMAAGAQAATAGRPSLADDINAIRTVVDGIDDAVDAYFIDGRVPKDGTRCQ